MRNNIQHAVESRKIHKQNITFNNIATLQTINLYEVQNTLKFVFCIHAQGENKIANDILLTCHIHVYML